MERFCKAVDEGLKNSLQQILETQVADHTGFTVQDVYKMIYQGVFGCEHALTSEAKDRFNAEYDNCEAKNEKLSELVSPLFSFYRVNLRAFKYHGGIGADLFEWFRKSSESKAGDLETFLSVWCAFKSINEEKKQFPQLEIDDFEEQFLREVNDKSLLPVLRHSELYTNYSKPSYRVVDFSIMPEKLKPMF